MFETVRRFFDSTAFMPHGHCYLWRSDVLWLNVGSDAIIAGAYFSIPIALAIFVKRKKDLAFNWIFRLFAAFIFACGATHLVEIWTVWNPDYFFQGVVKFYTGAVSAITAFLLWPLMPKALALPSPTSLQMANDKLGQEIAEKNKIQMELIDAKHGLELRVEQRTAELRRANKMKDEFLATLSHELRTPLNVIMGNADLLEVELPGSKNFQQSLETIRRNAKVQADLIEELLDVSRIITGKIQLESHLVDPSSIIESAIQAVKLSASAKQIEIETHFDDMTGLILGDSTRLQQVLWNLLLNAVKFSPKGGKVVITTHRQDSKLQIKVKDNGKGIDQEFLPYVFDRFRQEDSSYSRTYGGLGLGLAIVRHIVELHGGMVFAESEGRGKGATFTVILPIMSISSPKGSHEDKHAHIPLNLANDPFLTNSKVLKDIKLLLIDDELDTRILIRSILVRCGADVKVADSGKEARKILFTWLPHVIISDIGMSDENGLEFIRKLRTDTDRPESQLPAIALTAYARPEDRDATLSAGFNAHATKPIGAGRLIEIVLRVLPKP